MKHTEIEKRLIELAEKNPTGDYYVGSVGSDIRQLLKDMMGDRYPSDKLDEKPFILGPRPDESINPDAALMWDAAVRIEKMMVDKMSKSSGYWSSPIIPRPFPSGCGATSETTT